MIRVLPFEDMNAELTPRTIRLKRRGTTELAVDNTGNTTRTVQFFIEQEIDDLSVIVDPAVVDLVPGKATFANVLVRPRRTFWKGNSKTVPYQVAVLNQDRSGPPVYADGVVLQEQLLPKWLLRLLLALLAAALVLFILYQTVFKSVLESTARDAAKKETAAATDAASSAQQAAQSAANDAAKAAQAAQAGGGGGGAGASTTTVPGAVGEGGVLGQGSPTSFRLTSPTNANPTPPPPPPAAPTFVSSAPANIPNGKQLLLTDVVFQNSAGDTGVFQVRRGNEVLFEIGLNNFRDLDYHFVTPIIINPAVPGQNLTVAVACEATVSNGPCTASAYFAGVFSSPPPG
jgi:type II secretory pathway pseudopilin PulG